MAQRDNWGWRARIGMFIVGNEAVPEAEWWAMLPPNVSVHAARVTARAPWARWRDDHAGVELEDDLARGCQQFAAMRLSAVVVGHSSSSILGGKGWDEAVVAHLSAMLGAGTRVTTNGLDCVAALRALVPYHLTLDALCIKKVPSNQCRNDGGVGEAFRRGGRGTSGLGQIIAICPGDALDHPDVAQSAQLP